jgi:hypothetical protein
VIPALPNFDDRAPDQNLGFQLGVFFAEFPEGFGQNDARLVVSPRAPVAHAELVLDFGDFRTQAL